MELAGLAQFCTQNNIMTASNSLTFDAIDSLTLPLKYETFSLNYQRCYHSKNGRELDFPKIGNRGRAYWPLFASLQDSVKTLNSDGKYLFPPIVNTQESARATQRVLRRSFQNIQEFQNLNPQFELGTVKIESNFGSEIHPWLELAYENNLNVSAIPDCALSLEEPLENIYLNLGSSTKRDLSLGESLMRIKFIQGAEVFNFWNEFKKLHYEVAGRETRNTDTWNLQRQAVLNNNAFLVLAYEKSTSKLIAGVYIEHNNREAAYAVAATRREYFDAGINHLIQWKIIEHLKNKGVLLYRLGAKPSRTIQDSVTEKEISIGKFKRKFVRAPILEFQFNF
jgi:FemAB family protein